ncbi:MAG: isoprenyl transferase [Ardenticatenaceae bacterium]|nr:isoprenyl transferase [Ardenticatenaceae bacterium]
MILNKPDLDVSGLKIPQHVAIIMDGNGRWAKKRLLPRQAGHRAGVENLRRVIDACIEFGIEVLTIYAFSTENWGRPESEVRGLMRIFARVLDQEVYELHDQGVRIYHLGDLNGIDKNLQDKVHRAMELTRNNERLLLNVAFNYGGRAEILHAIRQLLADGVSPEELNEDVFGRYLFTSGLPDPDLVIRTSGEKRISNFLIWQAAYAEFYQTPIYWPDFDREALYDALLAYTGRDRRYGLLKD